MHLLYFRPEWILGIYIAACMALFLFHAGYLAGRQMQHRMIRRMLPLMTEELSQQIRLVKEGRLPNPAHQKHMEKTLNRIVGLRTFEQAMDFLQNQFSPEDLEHYFRQMRRTFLSLSVVYEKKNTLEQTYFSSLIGKFPINHRPSSFDGIILFCLNRVPSTDIACREKALKALFSIGNLESILAAWRLMASHQIRHSKKLLADGLLTFSGDGAYLARLLYDGRKEWGPDLTLPVMQFIRFFGGSFQADFLKLLLDQNGHKELQLESLRYFRKYPYHPARPFLQNILRYYESIDWEYAAMAALALTGFPGPDSVDCLKEGLHASNWYVRLNCADALINGLNTPQIDLFDIYNGPDRFAREILQYISDQAGIIS